MQFSETAKPPLGIVLDSDLGDGVQDLLAQALIYALEAHSETRIVSTSTTKSTLRSAQLGEVLAQFLSGPPPTGPAARFRRPPPTIGLADDGRLSQDTPVLKAVLDRKNPDGGFVYPRTIAKLNDTADPATLIRNAMTAQHDENCLVVLAGPATNLARVLGVLGAKELIKAKVRALYLACLPDQVRADLPAIQRVLADWPSPIVAVTEPVVFPGSSLGKEFAWADKHPIVDAYLAYRTMPYDAPAPALALLNAIRPGSGFVESAVGLLSANDDGSFGLAATGGGRHRLLTMDPARKAEIVETCVRLVAAPPLPRPMRRRPMPKKEEPPASAAPKPSGAPI